MSEPAPQQSAKEPVPGAAEIAACPRCHMRYRVAGLNAGARIRCGECGEVFSPTTTTPLSTPVASAQAPASAPAKSAAPAKANPFGLQATIVRKDATPAGTPLAPAASSAPATPGRTAFLPGQTGVVPQTVDDVLKLAIGPEKYSESEEIARGGMGVILKVHDRAVRRDVAMKVMRNDTNAVQRARFLEEAQVTGQLEHPNIVPIHELGVDARGRMFFSMKLVKGRSLADLLDEIRKKPDLNDREHSLTHLLSIFVSVCNAMAFAHSKNVVHRDLKPANIMIGGFGEVMVMDWGLAKVGVTRRIGEETGESDAVTSSAELGGDIEETISSFRNDSECERTIEGVIAGTPVYMSPEQARGNIKSIDARSDVYSLGAILYELLSLSQPVRGKDVEDILKKVRAGAIRPLEKSSGKRPVPKELAAITMKALATAQKNRYQTVEALIEDIELYLEGRAVSAKEDKPWESVLKLMRRNRAATAVTLAALVALMVVVVIGYRINANERRAAEQALAQFTAEQEHRREEQRKSAPAWVDKARRDVEHKDFSGAKLDVDQALEYNPELIEAHYLRAQLLIHDQDYKTALKPLAIYLKSQPNDKLALSLQKLCNEAHGTSSEITRTFAEAFLIGGASSFAETMMETVEGQLKAYRGRLDQAWPGSGRGLTMESDGTCALVITNRPLADLEPLRDLPLSSLDLTGTKVVDLAPIEGMSLTRLRLGDTKVRNLGPLIGMPLRQLSLANSEVTDLAALAGMPLVSLDLSGSQVKDLTPLRKMALTSLNLAGTKVDDFAVLKGLPLTSLDLNGLTISDLSALKGLRLTSLHLNNTGVSDLAPLRSMPLTELSLSNAKIFDLTPLQGMPLTHLFVDSTPIADLSSLLGVPLVQLDISNTKVTHLAALAGMPLERLGLNRTQVHDLAPLRSMHLTWLHLDRVPVSDLSPIKGMPLTWLVLSGTQVTDLSPLKDMPLEKIVLPRAPPIKGIEVLRAMPSLTEINVDLDSHTSAPVFWKTYTASSK